MDGDRSDGRERATMETETMNEDVQHGSPSLGPGSNDGEIDNEREGEVDEGLR